MGKLRIQQETVLALDISNIGKPYAKQMEHLALVRDGSTGEKRSHGYWLISVLGADVEGEDLTPLSGELYSQKAEAFRSENHQISDTVDRVKGEIGSRGIRAIDRGGDRSILFRGLAGRELRFVVVGQRELMLRGRRQKALRMAWRCPEQREVTVQRDGQRKGFGEIPLMLLTNLEVKKVGVIRILEIYLTRWKCEESYRYIKQCYNLTISPS